ncbi:RNA polymerase sigma factor [Lignipirellula cremea]|uniref:RNA polymerase sigma factor n=1 Tax=Lignipirellula cremea TaxID=2528010 RepID=UPI0011A27E85|nr:sigma-70 family RNA polymerase sigma factor [Lignipirellula cremea]
MTTGHTTVLARWLERLEVDCPNAREAVIEHTCERLRRMARGMLRTSPKVRRWTETDDLLQDALIRLHRSLAQVKPSSAKEFYGLAATQLRRQLIDLARKHYGVEGIGTNQIPDGGELVNQASRPPDTLNVWTEFHEQIDRLPRQEQEVVHLLWYKGLTQADAANVLGVSLATLKRRWQSARLTLADWMDCPQ